MAESQKIKIWPGERYDLPDKINLENFIEDDFQLRNLHLFGGGSTSWVIKGFITTDAGGLNINVGVANSALFNLTDTSSLKGTFFVGDSGLSSLTAELSDNTTSYIHVVLSEVTASPATRVFRDPTARDGLGEEYQQIVNTAIIKQASLIVSSSVSTDPAHILIAKVVTAGGNITSLIDERNLYFRLGKNSQYTALGKLSDPIFSGTGVDDLTASGSFAESADVHFVVEIDGGDPTSPNTFKWSDDGGETWDATGVAITGAPQLLGHNVSVTLAATTGHVTGDRWTFTAVASSGADYTYNLSSPTEPNPDSKIDTNAFYGGDKEVDNMKEWMDLVMSTFKQIKFGSTTVSESWIDGAPTNLSSFGIVLSGGGVVSWTCAPAGVGTLTWTEDFVLLLPGTAFSNYIKIAASPMTFLTADTVAFVDIDKNSNADLIPQIVASSAYTSGTNRLIIARRINDTIYVGT